MKNLITQLYTTDEINSMVQYLTNSIDVAVAKGSGLDMKARQGMRKMGTARLGYANMILPIAKNNLNVLPRDKDPQRLADLLLAYRDIAVVRGLAQKMLEWSDDTMKALGIDAVAEADSLATSLHNARRDSDTLDLEMGEVDTYNSRFGKQMEDEDAEGNTPTPDNGGITG